LRVFLTGGLGYLGGRLARILAAETGCTVSLGTRGALPQALTIADASLIRMDWSSDLSLLQACAGIDTLIHLAGMNAAACAADPVAALEFNGLATARLVRAATQQKVKRFVYLSTAHVYGGALVGSVDERTCPAPRHPYATSHRAGEDAVQLAQVAGKFECITVRLSNSFGAPADPATDCWSLVTNDLCRQAISTGRMVLRTSGAQRRDFIAISEVCRAILHLISIPTTAIVDSLFNVGGRWAPTLSEMADLVADRVAAAVGVRPQIQRGEPGTDIRDERLEFGVSRLLATGFVLREKEIVAEMDRLIEFCRRHFAGGVS
jgi:UDP-glucose 4-epimerase